MRIPLAILLCLFLLLACQRPSPLIEELKDTKKVEKAYYLYPSTLRMLNFQDDPSINKLVKEVDRLVVMKLYSDSFNYEKIVDLSTKFQEQEQYEVYLEIENEEQKIYLLGNEKKTIALGNYDSSYYMADIQGQLNLLVLPEVIESFSSRDNNAGTNGISMLFDLIGKNAKKEERRRKRQDEWEAKRKEKEREKQEESQVVPDSLRQDSIL
ncbi:MAG: hypothetical protein AAF985_25780 [Bacteroidota bacterium]